MQFGNKDHFKELLVISSVIFTAETIFENFLLICKPKTFMAQFFKIQIVDFVNFLFESLAPKTIFSQIIWWSAMSLYVDALFT